MSTYKQFLFTNKAMPKSTYYRRKRQEAKRRNLLAQQARDTAETILRTVPGAVEKSSAIENQRNLAQAQVVGKPEEAAHIAMDDLTFLPSQSTNEENSSFLTAHTPTDANSSDENRPRLQQPPPITTPFSTVQELFQQDTNNTLSLSPFSSLSTSQMQQPMNVNESILSLENNGLQVTDQPCSEPESDLSSDDEQDDITTPPNKLEDDLKFPQLCSCNGATVGDVLIMCLSLSIRHSLTWEAQLDIFRMVNSLYGKPLVQPNKYKQLGLSRDSGDVKIHYFCTDCEIILEGNPDEKGFLLCPSCNVHVSLNNSDNYFASVAIEPQLQKILSDPKLAEEIVSYRFKRHKVCDDNIEDLYDGLAYRNLCKENCILSSKFNFSYSFSTDGIKFGTSSTRTMWPLFLTISELSPKERSKHVILAGLYVGSHDPNQQMFLKPFVEEANKLSTVGLTWNFKGTIVNSKFVPLIAVADSVARYQILNMQSFAAKYGCTFCYHTSVPTRRGQRFTLKEEPVEVRTEQSIHDDLRKIPEMQQRRNMNEWQWRGVKGPSALMYLLYFNIIIGFVVDYMHAVLLGVIKTHTELILESIRKNFWIGMDDRMGIEHLKSAIDHRLLKIKPPSCISRTPRSIKDMKQWKASEWRSWLLFYAVPCLDGLLKPKHLQHISFLSKATFLLLQKSISHEDVKEAHRLYGLYIYYVEKYFGEEHMVYNVHLLSHICQGVLNWGPLWTNNSFLYEGQNHYLLKLYHSPGRIVKQVVQKYLVYSSINRLSQQMSSSEKTIEFCETVLNHRLKCAVRCDDYVLLGACTMSSFSEQEIACGLKQGLDIENSLIYQRMICKGFRITSESYRKQKKSCDAYVSIELNKFVKIERIIKIDECVWLIVRKIKVKRRPLIHNDEVVINFIKEIEGYGSLKCIAPKEITGQCIILDCNHAQFVCHMPSGCYND